MIYNRTNSSATANGAEGYEGLRMRASHVTSKKAERYSPAV